MTIVITQSFASNEDVLSLVSSNDESLMRLLTAGLAESGASATSGRFAVQDADFAGHKVAVTGTGLAYDSAGRLTGGQIDSIDFLNAAGTVIATLRQTGGLGFDVAGYNAAKNAPGTLPDYFGTIGITFDASAVPAPAFAFLHGAHFTGNFGADLIRGSAQIDILSGSHGVDRVFGGAGADVLYGDESGVTTVGFDETGNDKLYGGAADDVLYGNGGDDGLYGGAGNDYMVGDLLGETGLDKLFGGDGDDRFWGGEGDDVLKGGAGYDRIAPFLQRSGDFTVTINLARGTMTGEGTDRLISIEGATGALMQKNLLTGNEGSNGLIGGMMDDTLTGGAGADRLNGMLGADNVTGGKGADLIAGGQGVDRLTGGGGADRFVFADLGADHADRITDFAHGSDRLLLTSAVLFGTAGALSATAFKRIDTGAADADDRVLYDKASGELFIDLDGSGAATAILLARLSPGAALTASDIHLLSPLDILNFA